MNLYSHGRNETFSNRSYPPVSVILVNYNGYKWLQLCLPALLKTEYPRFEIIIVDNASIDESVDYLNREFDNQVKVIKLDRNLGFCEACNIGFRVSNGDIIALLNNDVEVDKKWLISSVERLQSNENVGSVQSKMMNYTNRQIIDCAGLSVNSYGLCIKIGYGEIDHGQYDDLPEIWASSGGAMIVWRRILMKTGLFDPAWFLYYDDVDLGWRIRLSGYRNMLAPSSLVYHMGSTTTKRASSSLIIFHSTKNYIASCLKNYSLKSLIIKMPMLFGILLGSMILELLNGRFNHFKARLNSVSWVLRNTNYILKERHKVQSIIRNRQVSDSIIFEKTAGISHIRTILQYKNL